MIKIPGVIKNVGEVPTYCFITVIVHFVVILGRKKMRKRYDFHIAENEEDAALSGPETDKLRRDSVHSVSCFVSLGLLVLLAVLFGIALAIDGILPKGLTRTDEVGTYPDAFIAERARETLKKLTDLGPKITGSEENEIKAVDILKNEIEAIKREANGNQTIETDWQVVSGSYLLGTYTINAYGNVQNLVVKLRSRTNSKISVLVNAHFDTIPTSPGGSDDGINCAVMLEVLRKLSRSPEPPNHNIIFLFNGAEETPLQASHGFITQHKWAKEVKVVINLEAAGAGGRICLFQTGPRKSWLMRYYAKVPHPFGTVTGEELFQHGIIPSDTDFRVFRDFGQTIGFDMAFIRDGYRYHTKYDNFSNIPLGSYQHSGDNTLSLVKSMANAPEMDHLDEQDLQHATYYDVFGLFVISYNDNLGIALNLIGIVLSIGAFVKSLRDFDMGVNKGTFKYLSIILGFTFLGWLLSVALVAFIAFILDVCLHTMSWYGSPWLVLGLYSAPIFLCCFGSIIFMNYVFKQTKISVNVQTQIQLHVARMMWTLVLFIGFILSVRSIYVVLILVIFHDVSFILIHLFKIQHSLRIWCFVYLAGTIIPALYLMYSGITLITFLIPITGRLGSIGNPEFLVGFATLLITILVAWMYVPFITMIRKPLFVIGFLASVFLIAFIIVFTPLGFPYSGNPEAPTPQRYMIFHQTRTYRNESGDVFRSDSGFFLFNSDRNSPRAIRKYVDDLNNVTSNNEACKLMLFCGFLINRSLQVQSADKSVWIPADAPTILEDKPNFKVHAKERINDTVWRYNVSASGPDHMSLYISPKFNVTLLNSSLTNKLPKANDWNGRLVYYALYSYGKPAVLNFTLDLKVPEGWDINNNKAVEVAVNGVYFFNKQNRTVQYEEFLSKFPPWTEVMALLGSYDSWIV